MNYNKLKYFYIVSKHLNFTKAAEELYISQSAISRHMKELEDEFGVRLFLRTNRNLILTNAGKVLYERIDDFFSKEDEMINAVKSAEHGETLELMIGTMGVKLAYSIPVITNEMMNEIPNLKISMQRFNWDMIYPALTRNEIHIGLRLRLGEHIEDNLDYFVLDKNTPSMIVHKTHRHATKKAAQLSDFSDDVFLLLSKSGSSVPFAHTQDLLKRTHIRPRKIIECSSPEELMMMVNSGVGVALMSRFAMLDQFPDIKTIDVKDSDALYLELIWLKDSNNTLIEKFVHKMFTFYH